MSDKHQRCMDLNRFTFTYIAFRNLLIIATECDQVWSSHHKWDQNRPSMLTRCLNCLLPLWFQTDHGDIGVDFIESMKTWTHPPVLRSYHDDWTWEHVFTSLTLTSGYTCAVDLCTTPTITKMLKFELICISLKYLHFSQLHFRGKYFTFYSTKLIWLL